MLWHQEFAFDVLCAGDEYAAIVAGSVAAVTVTLRENWQCCGRRDGRSKRSKL